MLATAQARRNMVDCQLRTFDVTDRAVLAAMDEVARERFVPAGMSALAYADRTITWPGGAADARVMLQPMVLARLIQALDIESGQRVLDVAGGSGYSACLLARLGASVITLDADPALSAAAREALADRDGRVEIRTGALAGGCPDAAPFDAILVNGRVDARPTVLLGQLADGGRLACLQGGGGVGRAVLYVRSGDAMGLRTLFDAAAPALAEFREAHAFQL